MRSRQSTSLAGSPILIGTVTVLITVVAVFLAYNANSGLPFVPTYRVTVEVPNAASLVEGNEVRSGGKRVGVVDRIVARTGAAHAYARLSLKLDKAIEPIRNDSRVTVRPRSPLGLKYLDLTPGARGRPIGQGGTLPLARARPTVELDEVINTFDAQTRLAAKRALDQGGTALAGRGADFNAFVASMPELTLRLDHVARNLSDPRTGLRAALRGVARVVGELAPVAPQLASLVDASDRTLAALESVSPQLAATIAGLPATELEGIRTLAAARPVLREARLLVHDVRPGIGVLPTAAARIHAALRTGIPVLRRASALSDRLRAALQEVEKLSSDPLTRSTLRRLRIALDSLLPTLRFVAPVQTKCNYLGVYLRNIASTVSEGDAAGNWLRTLVVVNNGQMQYRSSPAPDLHANPYPYTAAPGQHGLCEAGNEPYKAGAQVIGHAPGTKAHYTEDLGSPPRRSGR
jgi:phospholipid/cholesterol/gamma-HCH transport system substrate-binding protein